MKKQEEKAALNNFSKKIEREVKVEMKFLQRIILIVMAGILPFFYAVNVLYSFNQSSVRNHSQIKNDFSELSSLLSKTQSNSRRYLTENGIVSERKFVNDYFSAKLKVSPDLFVGYTLLDKNFKPVFTNGRMPIREDVAVRNYLTSRNPSQKDKIDFCYIKNELFLIESIENVQNSEQIGYQLLNFQIPELKADNLKLELLVVNQYGESIVGTDDTFLTGHLNKVDFPSQNIFFHNGNLILLGQMPLPYGLTTVQYEYVQIIQILILWWFLLILIVLSLMWRKTKKVTQKIVSTSSDELYELKQQMNEIVIGQRQFIEMQSNDEYMDISEEINELLREKSRLQKEFYEARMDSLRAENKKLEAQFNPHFLFNTLENVRVSISSHPEIAEEMIRLLNKILRYSIKGLDEMTKLKDELEYIQYYFRIYEIRHDQFSYSISMAPELNEIKLPKLLLLPIIENSLKYGLRNRNDLRIQLIVQKLDENWIEISIVDNGGGFDHEKIKFIQKMIRHPEAYSDHHGLVSASRRLRYVYPHSNLEVMTNAQESVVILEISRKDLKNV
ncbi:sensor histidine kinase [Lactovum odontotermitis]